MEALSYGMLRGRTALEVWPGRVVTLLTTTQKSGSPHGSLSAITISLLVLRGSLSDLQSPPDYIFLFTLKMKTVPNLASFCHFLFYGGHLPMMHFPSSSIAMFLTTISSAEASGCHLLISQPSGPLSYTVKHPSPEMRKGPEEVCILENP